MAADAGARGHGEDVRGRARAAQTGEQGAVGARGRQARGARGARRGRAAWACGLGVPGRAWCTGWASLGLMQPVWVLTWVFDSIVFLSHRLDSVHEHCS